MPGMPPKPPEAGLLFVRSVFGPVARTVDRLLPAAIERFALFTSARRFEHPLDAALAAQLVEVAPETGRQSGQVGRAERRGFLHLRAFNLSTEHIGLELHEEVVGYRAAVHAQGAQALAGVLLRSEEHTSELQP